MTCREVQKLLDLFLDGELEARTMRGVALHVTRCPACEALLQRFERLQDLIADTFSDVLAEVDFSTFWPHVSSRIQSLRRPLLAAPAALLDRLRAPAALTTLAAAAALALATLLWRGAAPWQVPARVNNQVRIDFLRSDAPSVALLSEPATNTTVIWVVDGEESR